MAILGLGRTPANTAGAFAGSGAGGNSMGIDYAKLAQEDMLRNANNRQAAASAPSGQSQAQAAWDEAMKLLQKPGPYTPQVVNQLTNRRADQTAAAEAVNAEEIRNQAAARGMDPTQAIRGLQQGRQAQNVAFSGDIASQAAVQNFAAEAPGNMMAAQANLNRQFGGATQPAVSGRTAFSAPQSSGGYNPGAVHQQTAAVTRGGQGPVVAGGSSPLQKPPLSVAERNALQTAWANSGGRTINGTPGTPATGPLQVAAPQRKPMDLTDPAFMSKRGAMPFMTPQEASDSWSNYK
jgi:hypothetical protein